MDYEQKYKVALERAKQFSKHPLQEDSANIVEYIFPELVESEDEKIRREILDVFKQLDEDTTICGRNYDYAKWIAWLEKQGETYTKKDIDDAYIEGMAFAKSELEKQVEQKPVIDIDIPFGAKDSELIEASYYIPEGFHAEIEGNNVVIKKGERKPAWNEKDENHLIHCVRLINNAENCSISEQENAINWLKSLKQRIGG